jgi:hypothetical protein
MSQIAPASNPSAWLDLQILLLKSSGTYFVTQKLHSP